MTEALPERRKVIVDAWAWMEKAHLDIDRQDRIRKALTLIPHTGPQFDDQAEEAKPIPLYTESKSWIGVAREYFFANRQPHHDVEYRCAPGDKQLWAEDLVWNEAYKLREQQQGAVRAVIESYRAGVLGGLVVGKPGFGKCLRVGTPVLRYDGTIVAVEALQPGDRLMGPDNQPRRILSTTRGRGPLYRITPVRGEPWVCNDAHILTLVHSLTGEVRDVPLQAWLRMGVAEKHYLKQFTPPAGIEFPAAPPVPLDPYFLGVWFGDGTKSLRGVSVSKPDPEIVALCRDLAAEYGLALRTSGQGTSLTHHIVSTDNNNPLLVRLREVVGDGLAFPHAYLTGSWAERRAFLAGLLDSDGHSIGGCFEIAQKRKAYAEGVAFLARSLGLSAVMSPKEVKGTTYWRVTLSGDFMGLPMRLPRKMPRPRLQKKCPTRTGFRASEIGEGDYAGFELDGDGRFLLGDFTVTHNTITGLRIVYELQVPTLVVVHKEFLAEQWRERILGNPKKGVPPLLPNARVGLAQENTCDYRGMHIVIGMVHSLAGRQYPKEFYDWPGLVITDECFVAGTQIATPAGPRAIEALQVGDVVLSAIGEGCVTECMVRRVPRSRLVRVSFADGTVCVCTPDHPFLAEDGWRPASELEGLEVWTWGGCTDTMRRHGFDASEDGDVCEVPDSGVGSTRSALLLSGLHGAVEAAQGAAPLVSGLRASSREAKAEQVLFAAVSAEGTGGRHAIVGRDDFGAGAPLASERSLDRAGCLSADDRAEPDAAPRDARQGLGGASSERASTSDSRGQGAGNARTAASTLRGAGGTVDRGARDSDRKEAPGSLHAGSRPGGGEEGGGGGRELAPDGAPTRGRSTQGCLPRRVRVVGVSSLEPEGPRGPDGCSLRDSELVGVYNLSVSGHPSYVLADSGVVVHNCHRTGARTWATVPAKFRARRRLGLTATPRRKDGCERVFRDHIGKVLYTATEQRLPFKVRRVWTEYQLPSNARVNTTLAGKATLLTFLCANIRRNKIIVDNLILALKVGRKIILLSERLDHLDRIERILVDAWTATPGAGPVPTIGRYVGGMTSAEREVSETKQMLLATYQFAAEGLDIPALDTAFLATPSNDVEQAVGRILRPCEGKKEAIVVDFRDDNIRSFKRAGEARDAYYRKSGAT